MLSDYIRHFNNWRRLAFCLIIGQHLKMVVLAFLMFWAVVGAITSILTLAVFTICEWFSFAFDRADFAARFPTYTVYSTRASSQAFFTKCKWEWFAFNMHNPCQLNIIYSDWIIEPIFHAASASEAAPVRIRLVLNRPLLVHIRLY